MVQWNINLVSDNEGYEKNDSYGDDNYNDDNNDNDIII